MNYKYLSGALILGFGCISIASAEPGSPSNYIHDAREKANRIANIDVALKNLEADAFGKQVANDAPRELSEAEKTEAKKSARHVTSNIISSAQSLAKVPESATEWARYGLDFRKAKAKNGKMVQVLKNGWTVEYTVDPDVQNDVMKSLKEAGARRGSVVLLDPKTGYVRAFAGLKDGTFSPSLALEADAPSASVFKVVTAAALIDDANIPADKRTCYHGGRSYLTERNIRGSKRHDRKCATLESALAFSINSIFAKLAYYNLPHKTLTSVAKRFGYNREIPFEFDVERSAAKLPLNKIERARAAAGFRHTKLSPLHSSMMAAAIANGGNMMRPRIVKRVRDVNGDVIFDAKPALWGRVAPRSTAKTLWNQMQATTTRGTARRYFKAKDFSGTASGKTGTLSDQKPVYTQYSWFSGSAEYKGRRIAVGSLMCNPPKWKKKGALAAREAFQAYFRAVGNDT